VIIKSINLNLCSRHLRNQNSEIPCQYCGRKTKQSLPFECGNLSPNTYARQHILPRRRGGHSNIENLKDCCKNCNDVLAVLDDCPGALACWRGVAVKLHLPDTASGAKGAHRRIQKQLKIAELNAMDPTALSLALAGKRQNKINRFFEKQSLPYLYSCVCTRHFARSERSE